VGRAIDSIKSERGEKTSSIEGLAIDEEYGKKTTGRNWTD
jgi:hypothetical protein